MLNDPRDPKAYRIAIAALGLAVAVVLVGISWVATVHGKVLVYVEKGSAHMQKDRTHIQIGHVLETGHVPVELWFAAGALGGVFVGALIPFSVHARSSCSCASERASCKWAWGSIVGALLLVAICVAATILGLVEGSLALYALGAAIAGVLLGLPIPSPGRRDR